MAEELKSPMTWGEAVATINNNFANLEKEATDEDNGLVTLSDSITSVSGVDGGIAATPKAVNDVYNFALKNSWSKIIDETVDLKISKEYKLSDLIDYDVIYFKWLRDTTKATTYNARLFYYESGNNSTYSYTSLSNEAANMWIKTYNTDNTIGNITTDSIRFASLFGDFKSIYETVSSSSYTPRYLKFVSSGECVGRLALYGLKIIPDII